MSHSRTTATIVLLLVIYAAPPAATNEWPVITAEEKALTQVPGHPNAPAVVLLRQGLVHLDDDNRSSYVDFFTRIKILNDEGRDYGTVAIASNEFMRTKDIEGRTHLPDGRVVNLEANATFEKEFSDYYSTSITSCALPEVVPGSIIEYRYRSYFDSVFYPRVWYFQFELPTIINTVTFELPRTMAFYPVEVDTLNHVELKRETKVNARGGILTYTMENLPAVPDEPYRFPFADLSARVVVLPGIDNSYNPPLHLFDKWESLMNIAFGGPTWGYVGFKKDARTAKKTARRLAASQPESPARAIYEWVRNEIELEPYVGVMVGEKTADEVIESQHGDAAELGLLLETMLDLAGLNADLVWANPRDQGRVMRHAPNPRQFDSLLVTIHRDGTNLFLDPSDSTVSYGELAPELQGVPCLVVKSRKKFEWSVTPQKTSTQSARIADINMDLNPDGSLSGTGRLQLTGNHAWKRFEWRDTEEETQTAWNEWIEDKYSGYDITDVTVDEQRDSDVITVTWSMNQRDEEVLGDESVIDPSSPLQTRRNPFTLTPRQRATPVQLRFPDTDTVNLKLSWPEAWIVDAEPPATEFSNAAGCYRTELTVDHEKRTAGYSRTMEIAEIEFIGGEAYTALHELLKTAVRQDTQSLILLVE